MLEADDHDGRGSSVMKGFLCQNLLEGHCNWKTWSLFQFIKIFLKWSWSSGDHAGDCNCVFHSRVIVHLEHKYCDTVTAEWIPERAAKGRMGSVYSVETMDKGRVPMPSEISSCYPECCAI